MSKVDPTWGVAAIEIEAHSRERSDLDPYTVRELVRHFWRIHDGQKFTASGAPCQKED